MKKKILMVDDDPDFINALKTILENAGYRCFHEHSTFKGIETYRRINPGLIILDVMIEDIASGFRMAHELNLLDKQSHKPHVPVLMISSVESITELDFKKRTGTSLMPVDDFMNKPVYPDVLIRKVKDMVLK